MEMKGHGIMRLTGVLVVLGMGCAPSEPETGFRPSSTINEIMLGIVEPSADAIWNANAVYVDEEGVHETAPETDEEWMDVRNAALRIVEASNLILVPGRQVGTPSEEEDNLATDRSPEQIQAQIDQDRGRFIELSHVLQDTGMYALREIDARNIDSLLDVGTYLDRACEGCHLEYWYPDDEEARRTYEEGGVGLPPLPLQ